MTAHAQSPGLQSPNPQSDENPGEMPWYRPPPLRELLLPALLGVSIGGISVVAWWIWDEEYKPQPTCAEAGFPPETCTQWERSRTGPNEDHTRGSIDPSGNADGMP